jgi:hypothetical protein
MNLWETLGISPVFGIGLAVLGLVAATFFASRRFGRTPERTRIDLGGRG